ncbi:hypothetical protein CO664_08770 [Sinorhizobium sp. NG07B]|nr:hypothetical protein CO664_08770 [Sinorhizobium sp. NG07B]
MPGGLVEMVTLGAERGGDERMISLIHAARIFLVVLALPFMIGVLTGQPLSRSGRSYVSVEEVNLQDLLWFSAAVLGGAALGRSDQHRLDKDGPFFFRFTAGGSVLRR